MPDHCMQMLKCVLKNPAIAALIVAAILNNPVGGFAGGTARTGMDAATPSDAGVDPAPPPPSAATDQKPGRIFGQITWDGNPPKLSPVVNHSDIKPADARVCKSDMIGNETLVVNDENRGIQFVFVWIERAPARPPERDLPPIKFGVSGCRFTPRGVFVQTGQRIELTNSDPIAHSVRTQPIRNLASNQCIAPDRPTVPLVYARQEKLPVEVKSDFLPWMRGYHLVLDHPWGAVTDDDGRFALPQLPPGTYELKIWHEQAGYLQRSLEVDVDGDQELSLKFAPENFEN